MLDLLCISAKSIFYEVSHHGSYYHNPPNELFQVYDNT